MNNRRRNVVRELMKEYRKLNDSQPNKKEIKGFLLDEMDRLFPSMENTEYHMESWIDNEFRCELEEKMEAFVSASFPNQKINFDFSNDEIKIDVSKLEIK